MPSKEYKKSFEAYVIAYKNAADNYYFAKYKKAMENFNEYSRKIIEKNNGKLLGTIFDEEESENLYKYSISTCNDK